MNISSHKEAIKALHKAEDAFNLVKKTKELVQLTKKYFI